MLSPEEIKSREFLVSLRGYDRDEVHAFLGRIAEEIAQTQARASDLEREVERLRRAGEQAATASEQRAPESAAFAEIGRETQRILEAAQEAGQQMQRRARQEADKELQTARSQAARHIAEGERRREQIERIVRSLDEARSALATDLRNVSRTIEQTLRDLSPTDTPSTSVRKAMETEARVSGAAAAPPATPPTQAPPADTQDEPSEGAAVETPPAAEPTNEPAEQAAETTATADEPTSADLVAEAQTDDEATATGDAPPSVEADRGAEPPAEPAATEQPEEEPQQPPAATETEAVGAAEPADDTEPQAPEAPGAPVDEAAASADVTETTAAEGSQDESEPAAPAEADASAVTADEVATEASVAAATDTTGDAGPSAAPTETPAPGARERTGATRDPSGLRASALSPLHPKLVRKLKRELQEVQNIALDRVRRSGGRGEVDDFLPQGEDARILGEGAGEFLEQAWRAGVAAAGTLAERDFDGAGQPPELASKFADEATERVRAGLGATLRMGMSAGEPPQALSDRIGAVFSELKGTSAEELSATHLIHAYEIGLLSTWRAGGVEARTWILGREPRCPEARCRQNDQSGPLPLDQAFPSGHDVPPVHVGCTCTTLPVAG